MAMTDTCQSCGRLWPDEGPCDICEAEEAYEDEQAALDDDRASLVLDDGN